MSLSAFLDFALMSTISSLSARTAGRIPTRNRSHAVRYVFLCHVLNGVTKLPQPTSAFDYLAGLRIHCQCILQDAKALVVQGISP